MSAQDHQGTDSQYGVVPLTGFPMGIGIVDNSIGSRRHDRVDETVAVGLANVARGPQELDGSLLGVYFILIVA